MLTKTGKTTKTKIISKFQFVLKIHKYINILMLKMLFDKNLWEVKILPTYIILGNFTQEGISKIKDSPQRLEAARKLAKSVGGEIKDFYYTLGRYDLVAIVEAPSNEAQFKALCIVGSGGATRTETLVAIPAEKAVEIIKELP